MVLVWDWKSGNILRVFNHKYFSYCILAHPIHEDLIFTAGDDGRLFVCFLGIIFLRKLII